MSFNSRSRAASDVASARCVDRRISFNSRSRAASDCARFDRLLTVRQFQLTLARGERRTASAPVSHTERFQLTLARGERRLGAVMVRAEVVFQLTLARGERPVAGDGCIGCDRVSTHARARRATSASLASVDRSSCFNSRSRAASDLKPMQLILAVASFNSRSRAASDASTDESAH